MKKSKEGRWLTPCSRYFDSDSEEEEDLQSGV